MGARRKGERNKRKRTGVEEKDSVRKRRREKREKEGDDKVIEQKTIENTREKDETLIDTNDEEIFADAETDEFASYFKDEETPKLLVTTGIKPTSRGSRMAKVLTRLFPNSQYRRRGTYGIKSICKWSSEKNFTNVMIIGEAERGDRQKKQLHTLTLIRLPDGPTASFKLSSLRLPKEIQGHGRATKHYPEVILNNFNTRLGHTIGRLFASLVPKRPEFEGRRVVTFHNQRDFIFFRHHRYIFDAENKARLQELGPRFTLKLRWLQKGCYNIDEAEFEWVYKKENETSRRRFFL